MPQEQAVIVVDGPYRNMVELIQESHHTLSTQFALHGNIANDLRRQAYLVGSERQLEAFITYWERYRLTAENCYEKDTIDASIFCNLQHAKPEWTRFFLPTVENLMAQEDFAVLLSAARVTAENVIMQEILLVLPSDKRLEIETSLAELSVASNLTIQQFLDTPPAAKDKKSENTKQFKQLIRNFKALGERLKELLSEYKPQLFAQTLMQKFIANNLGSTSFSYLAESVVDGPAAADHKKPAGLSIVYRRGEAAGNNFMLFNIENVTETIESKDPRRVTMMMSARSFPAEYNEALLRGLGLNFTVYSSVAAFNWQRLVKNEQVSGVLGLLFEGVFCRSRLSLLARKEQVAGYQNDRVFLRKKTGKLYGGPVDNYCDMVALTNFLRTTDISGDRAIESRLSRLRESDKSYQVFKASVARFAKSFEAWQGEMSNAQDRDSLGELLACCQVLCDVDSSEADMVAAFVKLGEKYFHYFQIVPELMARPIAITGRYEKKIMSVLDLFKRRFPAVINVEGFFYDEKPFSDLVKKTSGTNSAEAITAFILEEFGRRFPAVSDVKGFFYDLGLFSERGSFVKAQEASGTERTEKKKAFFADENCDVLLCLNLLNLRDFLSAKRYSMISEQLRQGKVDIDKFLNTLDQFSTIDEFKAAQYLVDPKKFQEIMQIFTDNYFQDIDELRMFKKFWDSENAKLSDSQGMAKMESTVLKEAVLKGVESFLTPEDRKEAAAESESVPTSLSKLGAPSKSRRAVVSTVDPEGYVSTEILTDLDRSLRHLLKQLKKILPWVVAVPDSGVHLERELSVMTPSENQQLCQVLKESKGFKGFTAAIATLKKAICDHQPGTVNLPSVFLSYCNDVVGDNEGCAGNAFTMLVTHYPHWCGVLRDIDYTKEVREAVTEVLTRFKRCLSSIYVEEISGASVRLVRCAQSKEPQKAPVGHGAMFASSAGGAAPSVPPSAPVYQGGVQVFLL